VSRSVRKTADPQRAHYHHGALQDVLVAAADAILVERGVDGFSLREAARRAGVSPAAPAHHFRSAAGLLSEVAARGFEELTGHLKEAAAETGGDPLARLRGQAIGYVRFALAFPGRFHLMFNKERLEKDHPRLRAAARAAHVELEQATRAYLGPAASERAVAAAAAGGWSLAHGFAHLAIDGKFEDLPKKKEGDRVEALLADWLPAVLANFRPIPEPRRQVPGKRP
jgi:AcrR family transcriptional regulator